MQTKRIDIFLPRIMDLARLCCSLYRQPYSTVCTYRKQTLTAVFWTHMIGSDLCVIKSAAYSVLIDGKGKR